MSANELLERLINLAQTKRTPTVDTVKSGDGNRQVNKAAVCFTATPNVIKAAGEWGADLLITHEPTYHDHFDNFDENQIEIEKRKLIESTDMTVFRFHDHAHAIVPDIIHHGFLKTLELECDNFESRFFEIKTPMTPLELAKLIEEKINVKHVRIVGNRDFKASRLALFLGAVGDICHIPLKERTADIAICGEVTEWKSCEFVRDAAEMGHNMAMLVLGHVASESDGMRLFAERIKNELGIETKFFDCGEVYTYTD